MYYKLTIARSKSMKLIAFLLEFSKWCRLLDHTKLWIGCLHPLWQLAWHRFFFGLFFLVNVKLIVTSVWLGMVHFSCFKPLQLPTMLKLLLLLCSRNMIRYLMYLLYPGHVFSTSKFHLIVINFNPMVMFLGYRRRFILFRCLYWVWHWQGIFDRKWHPWGWWFLWFWWRWCWRRFEW